MLEPIITSVQINLSDQAVSEIARDLVVISKQLGISIQQSQTIIEQVGIVELIEEGIGILPDSQKWC